MDNIYFRPDDKQPTLFSVLTCFQPLRELAVDIQNPDVLRGITIDGSNRLICPFHDIVASFSAFDLVHLAHALVGSRTCRAMKGSTNQICGDLNRWDLRICDAVPHLAR